MLHEKTSSSKDSLQSAKVKCKVLLSSGKSATMLMACEEFPGVGDRQAIVCCKMKANDL